MHKAVTLNQTNTRPIAAVQYERETRPMTGARAARRATPRAVPADRTHVSSVRAVTYAQPHRPSDPHSIDRIHSYSCTRHRQASQLRNRMYIV